MGGLAGRPPDLWSGCERQVGHQLPAQIGGCGPRLAFAGIDLSIPIGIEALESMVSQGDNLLDALCIAWVAEQLQGIMVNGSHPARDIGRAGLHLAGVQANIRRAIGLRGGQGGMCGGGSCVAIRAQDTEAVAGGDRASARRGRPLEVASLLALTNVDDTLRETSNRGCIPIPRQAL